MSGFKGARGEFVVPAPDHADVTPLGGIAFAAPTVRRGTRARLELRLITAQGKEAARNYLDLYFFARATASISTKIFAPELGERLRGLGYAVVDDRAQADVTVTTTMTEAMREHVLAGARVLFLAERDDAQQTHLNGINVASRSALGLAGDWASNMNWLAQDALFKGIPTDGLMNFAFADLTPEHIITGLRAYEFAESVHAGMFLGWIHRNHALIHERGMGRGRMMISTLRLSAHIGAHPVATAVFDDLLRRIADL